jgi:hypothetical protein
MQTSSSLRSLNASRDHSKAKKPKIPTAERQNFNFRELSRLGMLIRREREPEDLINPKQFLVDRKIDLEFRSQLLLVVMEKPTRKYAGSTFLDR